MSGSQWIAAAVAVPLATFLIAGCGGDDETTAQPVTTAEPTTTKQTTTTSETTESQTTTEDNGGTGAPEPGDDSGGGGSKSGGTPSYHPDKPDSPKNDVTPPPNTPQGKFEQYCNQNPGACG